MLLLLLTPLAAIVAAYVLYTREYQKNQRLKYLYTSSGMLQRASSGRRRDPGAARPLLQCLPRRHRDGVTAAGRDRHRLVAHHQHQARRARRTLTWC